MSRPFENCKFDHCDLPGQCVSEGKCHHQAQELVPMEAYLREKERAETEGTD